MNQAVYFAAAAFIHSRFEKRRPVIARQRIIRLVRTYLDIVEKSIS